MGYRQALEMQAILAELNMTPAFEYDGQKYGFDRLYGPEFDAVRPLLLRAGRLLEEKPYKHMNEQARIALSFARSGETGLTTALCVLANTCFEEGIIEAALSLTATLPRKWILAYGDLAAHLRNVQGPFAEAAKWIDRDERRVDRILDMLDEGALDPEKRAILFMRRSMMETGRVPTVKACAAFAFRHPSAAKRWPEFRRIHRAAKFWMREAG